MKKTSHGDQDLMRLFVAVELNEEVRKTLANEQARLKHAVDGVKWVLPEHIHLTLAFLGDVFGGQVEGITKLLDAEAGACPAFALEVVGLGVFGSDRSPRVVWAGIGQGAEQTTALAGRISEGLSALNLSLEARPFHPHLTLGRIKTPREARGLDQALAQPKPVAYGVVVVDGILLMRSEIRPQGPIYTVVHKSFLA